MRSLLLRSEKYSRLCKRVSMGPDLACLYVTHLTATSTASFKANEARLGKLWQRSKLLLALPLYIVVVLLPLRLLLLRLAVLCKLSLILGLLLVLLLAGDALELGGTAAQGVC